MAMPQVTRVDAAQPLTEGPWDALVVVSPSFDLRPWPTLKSFVSQIADVDAEARRSVSLHVADAAPGQRLVLAPTGPVDRDHDDVRRFGDAARAGLVRARQAGAERPLLLIEGQPAGSAYARAHDVSVLQALGSTWEPLEAREALGESEAEPLRMLGLVSDSVDDARLRRVESLEHGRRLARDLGGTEPERMAPPRFAQYLRAAFDGTDVNVQVKDDPSSLLETHPLLMAVARASIPVEQHRPRVIRLTWEGDGPIERTIFLAGKAVCYDTGGADIKAGGHMAGMSRDKGGGGCVAGFVEAIRRLRPRGVRVVADIGAVRNSVGSRAYVSDEIVTSHAGVRVRIGNTDAEGRLVLADLLSHLRSEAVEAPGPELYTLATLTGHSMRAMGQYSVALDNGPARDRGTAERLVRVGDVWGDPFELSRLRREDFDFVRPRTSAEDVVSANTAPSTATDRGHQFPMAFLSIASGLSAHGLQGRPPLPFTHIDLGGSFCEGGDWQHGRPTAASVVSLVASVLDA